MENKNQVFNLPLASFTFGKNENQIENNIYMNNSKSLYMNAQQNIDIKKASIQPSLSQDYLQSSKYNKYNTSLSNNFSSNIQKMIDSNKTKNTNIVNFNNSNYFNNTNQSSKMINLNYGGELTFGQSNESMKNFNKENNNQNDFNNVYNNSLKNNNNYFISNINSNNDTINLKNIKDINNKIFFPVFSDDKSIDINSYIIVILYSIYHMRSLKEYILNLNFGEQQGNINNKEINNNILYSLKKIYLQIGNNSNININDLKQSLSYLFNNRSKFILNQPDDAVDLFFVILNAIHSFSIRSPLNEISDEICNNSKCFSHRFIWMDLTRIDECECNGTSRRLFSNHNYITDIPMIQIFSLINNYNNKSPKYILAANYQKLFFYYKEILHNLNMNCPLNGNRCNINKIYHRLFLGNSPSYFIFHLDYNQSNNNIFNSYCLLNILKCFVLISKSLDISTLFEENIRNKNDYNFNKNYNLIGFVFLSLTKIYSCAFKSMNNTNNNNNNILYNYFNGDNCLSFNTFYDLVVFCLKNGLIPIMLFYQESQINNNNLYDNFNNDTLTKEQINQLENYSINIDNLFRTTSHNKIRNYENVLIPISHRNINNNPNNTPATNSLNLNQPNSMNKNNKIAMNQIINNENIMDNNYYNNNPQSKYNSKSYKVKSNINQSIKLNQMYSETEVRSSLKNQNQKNYSNKNNLGDNYYSGNQINNMKTNDNNNIINNENNSNKKYKKVNEYEINNKNNKIPKSINEEFSMNNWDLPMPYIHYKKEEPIAILPIQNQTSIEINTKNNSNNYFYRKHINNMQINNVNNPVDIKKSEFKQKSNSYTKKHGDNIKSIINRLNSNNNNNINPNSDNGNNIKNRPPLNKEYKINANNSDYNRNVNINYSYNYNNNPNSFNKNHNLRNIIKDKYTFNKINKSNFDVSSNRPNNFRYDNNSNISNISYNNNQNVRNISDDIIFSEEIKKKFKNKKLINQMINYSSNNKAKNNINTHKNNNNDKIVSKSDDNSNSNIYNFNYIYNNNNFDMNILGNNIDKNTNAIHKSYEKTKNNLKRNNNNNIININSISNVNSNNSMYNNEKDNKIYKNEAKSNDAGHWTCDYCSNINREDYMYCKICKRSKNGKILRINTQILNYKHSQKAHSKKMGDRPSANNSKKNGIHKKKSIKSNNSNKANNSNKNNKYSLKKFKRNTMVGFSSTKKFNDNINYNEYINQDEKLKDFNNMELKKEYSFTKASFDNRKYNIY